MSIGLNDPRLTAYALGELAGAEKAAVEKALEESGALRKAVEEIRATGEEISAALQHEECVGLTEDQLVTINRRAVQQSRPNRLWVSMAGLSAAACVVLAFFLSRELTPPPSSSEGVESVARPPLARPEAQADELGFASSTGPKPNASQAEARIVKPDAGSAARVGPKPDPSPEYPAATQSRASSSTPVRERAANPSTAAAVSEGSGAVQGEVLDETGGVLPGATVELTQLAAGKTWATIAGQEGSFRFAQVPAGPAELKASLEGFKTYQNNFELGDQPLRLDPVLTVGTVSEAITVVSKPSRLDTVQSKVEELARPPAPANLPVNGRSVQGLMELKSGVAAAKESFPASQPTAPPVSVDSAPPADSEFNTESYSRIDENPFRVVVQNPLSTFSIDVDTASYSNMRRFLNEGSLPPADAVRIEELINYFNYDYPQPVGDDPFSVTTEIAEAPWNREHLLVRVGLKGRELSRGDRPSSNLVFLIDVSGSMNEPNKLPLLVRAMKLLVEKLGAKDRVAIVVYAGSSGVVLPSTPGNQKAVILGTLDRLNAGGSTHGSAGIRQAYEIARDNFVRGGINRVILATDGDFNVGTTSQGELTRLIEQEAKSGVFLSVLGFGMGNYKDSMLESLADKGNGNYGYIDTLNEARKLLVEQMDGTLVTIAKDVKIQVEFNPAQVSGYRLIGYENRSLRDEDFNDDTKDAGEIGAGHTVTALYELVPVGAAVEASTVDPLKYQRSGGLDTRFAHELMTVKLRYKKPDQEVSRLIERAVRDEGRSFANSSNDFKFSAAVALFGMLLRDSKYCGHSTYATVLSLANQGLDQDRFGYRSEFVDLVRKAQELAR